MKNNKIIHFVQSLVFVPVVFGGIHSTEIYQNMLVQKLNTEASATVTIDPEVVLKEIKTQKKAESIDAYFKKYDMPLEGMGMKMVIEAEKNGLDWRLLAAIAVRESTGGKFACKTVGYNSFGWGSCKLGFNSNEEAIETVGRNLGGNHSKTAHHYANKTTKEILRAYNPPSVVPRYAEQVISIMNAIGDEEVEVAEQLITPKNT